MDVRSAPFRKPRGPETLPLETGGLHGVPTPYNRMLQEVAAEAVREKRVPGSYSVEEMVERAKRLG